MKIVSDKDCSGFIEHPWAKYFDVLGYAGGGFSVIPHGFFRNWLDEQVSDQALTFQIGRCSGFGVGSIVKYDGPHQSLRLGRFVAGGLRVKLLLNGQHEMRTISTAMFHVQGCGLQSVAAPQYGDTVIKNDVWIGDEVMILGGGTIEDGCVIGARSLLPPRFKSEPYGIYAGSPAKLIRFRFSEKVRSDLMELQWWDMPMAWIAEHNRSFLVDLTEDEGASSEMLQELNRNRQAMAAGDQANARRAVA